MRQGKLSGGEMKTNVTLGIVVMVLLLAVTGCGKEEIIRNDNTLSLEDAIAEATAKEEKYVYDYQVSMDPIPEEIAALGGEVCGTIHAYPVEIMIGLAQKEIEENPEWQKQNEENIEFLKQYLTKEHGGEYEIRPMTSDFSQDEFMSNNYMCTENSTGKEFGVRIFRNPYVELTESDVRNDYYFYVDNAKKYRKDIEESLNEFLGDEYVYGTFYETMESTEILNILVACFREENIDILSEQQKIIDFYKNIKGIQKTSSGKFTFRIVFTYFPMEYQDVITQQYQSTCRKNYIKIIGERTTKLIEEGEVYAQFEYEERDAVLEEKSLEDVINNQKEYMENPYKLQYWR